MRPHHVSTGADLRRFRYERKLSTGKVAKALGISEAALRAKEEADAPLSPYQMGAVIQSFGKEPIRTRALAVRAVLMAFAFAAGCGLGVTL